MTNKSRIAPILGSIPSGLFVVTIQNGDEKGAFLASWIQQVSFDPPMVTIAMSKDRPIGSWFVKDSIFGVHVLADHHKKLFKHFANPPEDPSQIFSGLQLQTSKHGVPILTESLGLLECSVEKKISTGDHELIIGHVLDAHEFEDVKPKVHIRKTGFQY